MNQSEIILKLEAFNDPKFSFEKEWHKYMYNGHTLLSCTKKKSQYIKKFDPEGKTGKAEKEHNMTKEQVIKMWKENAEIAARTGTFIHKLISDYYVTKRSALDSLSEAVTSRFIAWLEWHDTDMKDFVLIAQELPIFSKKYKLASTLDALYYVPSLGKGLLIDWKTHDDFKVDNHFEKLLHPFNEFYQSHRTEYSLQLAIEEIILEEQGIELLDSFIVWLPPKGKVQVIERDLGIKKIMKNELENTIPPEKSKWELLQESIKLKKTQNSNVVIITDKAAPTIHVQQPLFEVEWNLKESLSMKQDNTELNEQAKVAISNQGSPNAFAQATPWVPKKGRSSF